MDKTTAALVTLGILSLSSCSRPARDPPPQEVRGQIFITLENRETIKMSLVTVVVWESQGWRAHEKSTAESCAERKRDLETKIAALQAQVGPLDDSIHEKEKEIEEQRANWREA